MSEVVPKPHCWSRAEYERLVDAGAFDPQARLELLDGAIIDMSPQGSTHASACDLVEAALRSCLQRDHLVRSQKPLALDAHSEPEPDIFVVKGAIRGFVDRHPETAELVVEVSDTSLPLDRGRKLAADARNGIPDDWILNLRDRQLEVHREPAGDAYRDRAVLLTVDVVVPLAAPGCPIPVGDLLP